MALGGNEDRSVRFETWLRWMLVAVSIFTMVLFVVTALRRLCYPYELEELEGYVFLTALRVFHGQPIYPHPSIAFVPYMYPPLYYYVCAALGKLAGMTISTMRLTSILSTLGCFAGIYALVWNELPRQLRGMRQLAPLAAAGLYAGCYTVCQEWFDLGRLDSFFILLVLLAMLATRRAHPVLAAVAWTLAFLTKQSILPAAFVMLCYDWPLHWRQNRTQARRTLSGVIALAVGAGGSVAWLNHITHGWYSFIVFTVPRANADIKLRLMAVFWPAEMLRPLGLALLVIVAAVVLTRPRLRSRATRFYLASCSLVPLFWWISAHAGSTANAPMPIYALVAVLFGVALARLLSWLPLKGGQWAQAGLLLVLIAAVGQEAQGIYNPGDYRPADEVRRSIAAVVAQVRTTPGDVDVTRHPYYAWLAGKPVQADMVSIRDAERPDSPVRAQLQAELQSALTQHRYNAIFFDSPASIRDFDKIAGGAPDWQSFYGISEEIPGVRQGARPDWLLEHCAGPPCTR